VSNTPRNKGGIFIRYVVVLY